MKNTLDDVMKSVFTPEEIKEINTNVAQEVARVRGGRRKGAGRKKKPEDTVLKFQIRVSLNEKTFLQWARKNNFDYKLAMS